MIDEKKYTFYNGTKSQRQTINEVQKLFSFTQTIHFFHLLFPSSLQQAQPTHPVVRDIIIVLKMTFMFKTQFQPKTGNTFFLLYVQI